MRGGIVLIVIGLTLGFMAVLGKICCLTQLFDCVGSSSENPCQCSATATSAMKTPSLNDSLTELLKPVDLPGVVYPYTGQ